jgi:hypothetical protein
MRGTGLFRFSVPAGASEVKPQTTAWDDREASPLSATWASWIRRG